MTALACTAKSHSVWSAFKIADESRQACGGHGFSKYAVLGDIMEATDVAKSSEGDNNTILLLTAKYLLAQTKNAITANFSEVPSMRFLKHESVPQPPGPKYSLRCFRSMAQLLSDRANYYCHLTHHFVEGINAQKMNGIEYLHPIQVKKMCEAWFDFYTATAYIDHISKITDQGTKKVFEDIFRLYLLCKIDSEADYFRELLGDDEFESTRDQILQLLKSLRNEVILLTEAFPFPDSIMGVLGAKDLNVYPRFLKMLQSTPGVEERAKFWKKLHMD